MRGADLLIQIIERCDGFFGQRKPLRVLNASRVIEYILFDRFGRQERPVEQFVAAKGSGGEWPGPIQTMLSGQFAFDLLPMLLYFE